MKHAFVAAVWMILAPVLAGCSVVGSDLGKSPSPPNSMDFVAPADERSAEAGQGSLFKEDQAAISNEALAQILAAEIKLPAKAKLTVVRVGQLPYWWGWSEDFVRTNQSLDSDFLGKLASSPHIREVAYLPSLVTPADMTLPRLRSAAARFQSDLVLIYRTSTNSYNRQRFFHSDETKAYCTVEAVLLDVRTGLIPFSTVVTEQFSATKQANDYDVYETQAKANQQAIAKAWLNLAGQTVDFLNKQTAGK